MFADADLWLRFFGPLFLMVGVGLAAALHAATRSDEAWSSVGQNKILWVILNALFWPAAIPYFLFVATRLRKAAPRMSKT